jgi:alkylation response protein AidB-like acyl-CoA dehydrogenase
MLSPAERSWLASNAETLDADNSLADGVVPFLAGAGLFKVGVPRHLGGYGGTVWDAVEAISAVAEYSLAAAFTFWGHRSFIEYLLQSPNRALREQLLPTLLNGSHGGATGLSNAMKYLGGIESLGIAAIPQADGSGWLLSGSVPWCTNLRGAGFVTAVAVSREGYGAPFVAALRSDLDGLSRSSDLDLIALRGSNTASLQVKNVPLQTSDVIHEDANVFLPQVRPAFLGLQCALSIGLARAALATATERTGAGRNVLTPAIQAQKSALNDAVNALRSGLAEGQFRLRPQALFAIRLQLVEIVQQALLLELNSSGGRAYHRDQGLTFARRWREAAFIPIVTPSVTQLQGALAQFAAQEAANCAKAAA